MKLGIRVHQGRLGAEQFRVIRPARPVTGAVLGRKAPWVLLGSTLTPPSPLPDCGCPQPGHRTLIHVPLRGNTPPVPSRATMATGELDLVLGHSDLPFAPNRWKPLRQSRGDRAAHTITWDPDDVPAWEHVHRFKHRTRRHCSDRDSMHGRLHAHTLVLTGNEGAFRSTARNVLDTALWQPDPSHPDGYSATLHPADGDFAVTGRGIYLVR